MNIVGKGTVSEIRATEDMVKDNYGQTADIIAYESSIFNRMDSCPHIGRCVENFSNCRKPKWKHMVIRSETW